MRIASTGHCEQLETHERLIVSEQVAIGSNRALGLAFTVVFTVIGLFPLLGGGTPRRWLLAIAGLILAVALVKPKWLAPLNRVWFKFSQLLHKVVRPLVMATLYYAVVTPTGLVMRALRRDLLRLRHDPDSESYWIQRDAPGPEPETMRRQF